MAERKKDKAHMEATLDEFEGVCKQLEVGGKFNTKAGYRFAELLELLFHYGIKPETNAWDYFAHLTNSVPSNDVPAAEALVNFAQTAASTSRGRVRAFLFCCMAKHTLPEIFFSLLWNRDLGAACYTNAAESIVLNDELETKLEETLGAASKALKLCPRSLIPTVPLDAKNFWHVVFSAFTQPSQLYAKLSEAIKALVEEVCTDSGSSSVVESNNEKAAIVVHILSEILSEETMGKTAWPLLKAFSNVPVVEAPHPETNVESWVMLCLNTSSLTSQIKATLFNHRNVLDKFYTRDSYFFNSASEEKLTIELTLLETLHFNFNVLSSDTTIQRHVTKKHKRKKKSIATIMGPEEENPQNNEDEHTTKSTGALKRDKGKRETLRKNHSVEGSIGLREEEEEETEHITTIKEGNETHHNKGHPAEDKIPKEKQSYTTEYQLLNEKCVNTNPFEDNSYEREVNANPFKDDSRETETNINPFKEEVPPGEKNLFEDDNRETERNTNPFKEEVSPEETNPFEDNNRETETNTNPFEEEVPPEETNPFEDDNRETETNTNPFEEEVPPEETNPFEDEPSSEKTKTNPFKDKKPEIPKVSQPENNDCERSIKSDEQKHKKEGTIKSERNSLNKSSTMESLSSHKKALNEGLLTPVTAIQINPFEFDKDESQNSLDRSAEENTKRQNLSNTGDDSQRKSLQGVDKPRVFTEDNLNEKQSKVITNKRTQKTTSEKAYETHHFEDNELNETRHLVTTENKVINSEKGDQETKGLETQVHFDRKESSTMSNITFGFPQTIQSKRTEADSLKFEKVSKADKVIDYDDFQECYFKRTNVSIKIYDKINVITDYRSLTQPTVQSFHLVKSFVRQGPSEEEEARLASESRKELFEEIPDESELPLLISKKYAKYSSTWNDTCPECGKKLTQSLFSWGAKFCNYTGKYYCTECFGNAKSVIPAKLFNNWDSTEYSVSSQSKCLIDMHMRDPIFHYYHINPEIRRTNLTLEAVIGLRKRIKLFYPYISSCANGSKLIYEFGERKYYLTSAYQLSLQDLVDCISRKSYVQLEGFVKQLLDHVAGCQSCKGKGFYCEICGGKKGGILFSFSLPEEAVCCPKCHSFVHTKCAKTIPGGFTPMTCPKCCRIEDFKRKKAIKEGKSEKDNTQ